MIPALPNVPVTMGSPVFRSLGLAGFDVVEAWFAPGDELTPHTHDRACVAVMLGGSFTLRIDRGQFHCPPASVFTEPAGEKHSNRIGASGARVLVVQPDHGQPELIRPFAGLLERTSHRHHAGIAERAGRLAAELGRPDNLAPLAAEGIVLEMLVSLTRMVDEPVRPTPPWLLRAQELLHARFAEPLSAGEIAREAPFQLGADARVIAARERSGLEVRVELAQLVAVHRDVCLIARERTGALARKKRTQQPGERRGGERGAEQPEKRHSSSFAARLRWASLTGGSDFSSRTRRK
jgi:quercetin dioxygenase-like cupin family protein